MEITFPALLDLAEIKEAISALYDECLHNSLPFHRKLDLFIVPDSFAQMVEEATGIDVSGHYVCIDNYGSYTPCNSMATPSRRQGEDR
jgi:hypothetical protein